MENTLGAPQTTENANTTAPSTTASAAPTAPSAEPPAAARPSETHAVAPARTENAAYASTEDAETQNKKEEEGILDQSELKGSGPRPLEVVAKENGGDANVASGSSSEKQSRSEDKLSESTGQGTGEQYVKSTGLTADGGDFDATNPGAGKEADRM
jgi:hypothetical protein